MSVYNKSIYYGSYMSNSSIRLTVLFKEPFWIGFFEKNDYEGYSVARTVFGAEPTNIELYQFLLKYYDTLKFSKLVDEEEVVHKPEKRINPKRRQREAQKELNNKSTVTKAHEAIKLMQGQVKDERKKNNKLYRDEEKALKFELKQAKKKKKHRGH